MDVIKNATDWRWRCPTCGRTGAAKGRSGFVFRIGTSGSTRSLGRCSGCNAWRMLVLERASDPVTKSQSGTSNADQERTWSELIAYVSEGTMTADLANQIAASAAPESRKREVAAHVAEGAINTEDVGKLLG